MRERICEICGNTYTTDAPNTKYCCLECREIARREHRKAWETDNADYSKVYAQMRRKALRAIQ